MRSITAGPSIKETILISFWHFGQRSGSDFQTFLISSRHFLDGMRRGLCSETSITEAALPSGWTTAAACLLRRPRILLEYHP